MDFLNKLLHRNSTGEGAASPQSAEARDNRGHSKSEIYLNNKNLNDAASPSKTPRTSGKLSEQKYEGNGEQKTEEKYDEEEDQFEDAQENKLSLTLLAENLNKVHLTTPGRKDVGRAVAHEFADDIVYGDESLDVNSSSFYESFEIKSGEQSSESSFLVTNSTVEVSDYEDKINTSSKISSISTPSENLDHTVGESECPESRSPNTTAASTINNSFSTNESSVSILNKESKINITLEEHSVSKVSDFDKSETSLQEELKDPEIVPVVPTITAEDCKKPFIAAVVNICSNNKVSNSACVTLEESCVNSLDEQTDSEISISLPTEGNNSELSESITTSSVTAIEEEENKKDVQETIQLDGKQESSELGNVLEDGENTPSAPLNSEVIVNKLKPSESAISVNDSSVEKVMGEEIIDQAGVKPVQPNISQLVDSVSELKLYDTVVSSSKVNINTSSDERIVEENVTHTQGKSTQPEIVNMDKNYSIDLSERSIDSFIVKVDDCSPTEILKKENDAVGEEKEIQQECSFHAGLDNSKLDSKESSSTPEGDVNNSLTVESITPEESDDTHVEVKPSQTETMHKISESSTNVSENVVNDMDEAISKEAEKIRKLQANIVPHETEHLDQDSVEVGNNKFSSLNENQYNCPEASCAEPVSVSELSIDASGNIKESTVKSELNEVDKVTEAQEKITGHVLKESVKSPSELTEDKQVTQIVETPIIDSVKKTVSEITFDELSAGVLEVPIVTVTNVEEIPNMPAQSNILNTEVNDVLTEEPSKSITNTTKASTDVDLVESNFNNSSIIVTTAEEDKLVAAQSESEFCKVDAVALPVKALDDANNSVVKITSTEEGDVTKIEEKLETLNCDKIVSSMLLTDLSQSNVEDGIITPVVTQTEKEEITIQMQDKAALPKIENLEIKTSVFTEAKKAEQENPLLFENLLSEINTAVVSQTKEAEQEKAQLPQNVLLEINTSVVTQTKEVEQDKPLPSENILSEINTFVAMETIEAEQDKHLPSENVLSEINTAVVTETKEVEQDKPLPSKNILSEINTSDVTDTKEVEQNKPLPSKNVLSEINTSVVTETKEVEQDKPLPSENILLEINTSDVTDTKEVEQDKPLPSENILSEINTSDVTDTKEVEQNKPLLSKNVLSDINSSGVTESKEAEQNKPLPSENVLSEINTSVLTETKEVEQDKPLLSENVLLEINTTVITQAKDAESSIQIQEKDVLTENVCLDNEVKIGSSDTQENLNCPPEIIENVGGSCVVAENSEGNTSVVVSSKLSGGLNMKASEDVMVEKPQGKIQTVKDQAVDLVSNKTALPKDDSKDHLINKSECKEEPTTDSTSLNGNSLGGDLAGTANQQKCPAVDFKISPTKEKQLTKFNASPNKFSNFKASPKRNLLKDFKASARNSKENAVEFFIAGDKKSDALEFDERVAEEAANISDHILNVSLELQESDSDSDNNKTVISLLQQQSPRRPNVPQPQITLRQTQDSVPLQSIMQSMRSVLPAHLNQSEAGPITADELNSHDLEFQDGASLDLDFFNQVGSSDSAIKNSLTRNSLYVKFDPIVNAVVSNTIRDSIRMPPPAVPDQEKPSDEQPTSDQAAESKAVDATPDAQKTPLRSPALEAVQKLISLTPPSSTQPTTSPPKSDRGPVGTPVATSPKMAGISQEQLQKELKKLETIMKDREKHFESVLSKKEEELEAEATRRVALEAELKASSERELRLKKEVQERTKSKQQLSLVMEEYEKTISQLVAQKEEDKKEYEIQKDILMKERDTAMQHLNNMEIAFSDVHQKYERSKGVIEGMKANEEMLRRGVAEYDEAVKSSNNRYEALKNHAVKQLETANTELDLTRRAHQAELAKLNAMMKKTDLRVKSLEESLERKTKENQELAAICDELINKVGN